ncbi:MAG: 6-bladed beta-propeller [Gemmatimonadaceae bacterium]|nr:6-bladed beta-propeller [Gemmatimonadaceae bacterium]
MSMVCLGSRVVAQGARRADTVRVHATDAPTWGTSLRLEPVQTIGALDGPPEYAFGELSTVVVDRRGRVYTYDEKDHQVRAYDANGRFFTTVGRKGGGPGEYRFVADMVILSDSLLVVFDPSSARLTVFAPSGKLVRTISEPRANSWGGKMLFASPQGRVFVRVSVRGAKSSLSESESRAALGARYLGFDVTGRLVDSVNAAFPRTVAPRPRSFYLMLAEGGHSAFQPSPTMVAAPDGSIIAGTGESMRFSVTPRQGPVRVIDRPWIAVALDRAERANWQAWAAYFSKQDGGRYRYDIPSVKPAYHDLAIDATSRVWVSVFATAERRDLAARAANDARPLLVWRQRATYDVYELSGTYLGRVILPHGEAMLQAIGDHVWAMGKGPDDEQRIIKYRLVRPIAR